MGEAAAATEFSRWRRHCQMTKAQAARELRTTWTRVQILDRGYDYSGRPVMPSANLQRLMGAIAEFGADRIKPWPVENGD